MRAAGGDAERFVTDLLPIEYAAEYVRVTFLSPYAGDPEATMTIVMTPSCYHSLARKLTGCVRAH